MPNASELHPVNPDTIPDAEKETEAPWIVRKLAGSIPGRIVMSSYESLRATGASVVCLSPWGDSSPLLLPCIRFRDLAMHMVIVATGGTATIAAPIMGPVGHALISSFGDTIFVELGLHAGFELTVKAADDLLILDPIKHVIPANDRRLTTTATKSLTITLSYKHTITDAALGFFRASTHADTSLFSSVKDYLAIEKGWFSPYLFASGRRPIIPRTMTPDVVFCHGPFLGGDYKIGETLLNESALVIALCKWTPSSPTHTERASRSHLHLPSLSDMIANTTSKFSRSRSRSPSPSPSPSPLPSPSPSTTPSTPPSTTTLDPSIPTTLPPPRRMVLLVLGIKPHRHYWTTSARPSESVIEYILLNGCPAIVVPVRPGSPLVGWDTLTLEQLHKIGKQPGGVESPKAKGVVKVLVEYLELCVDWERVVVPGEVEAEEKKKQDVEAGGNALREVGGVASEKESKEQGEADLKAKQTALEEAVSVLIAGAINSGSSKEARKAVDFERAGIVMFRIP